MLLLVNTSNGSLAAGRAQNTNPPLVAHIVHRFDVGGLENGLVNLINGTDRDRYRHAIISLTEHSDFRSRVRRTDVPFIALQKRPGKDFRTHFRLWRVLRNLRPAIVHTRNLPALEFLLIAALAGIPARVHGEHGRDTYDLDGSSRKYNLLRKALSPFVSRYTAVSKDLVQWLIDTVELPAEKIVHICNGVDTQRFYPRLGGRGPIGPAGFVQEGTIVMGTVGRMQTVKDQPTLVRAFLRLVGTDAEAHKHLRLIVVGDGPLREESLNLIHAADADALAWFPGERGDIPEIMRAMDLFVLPSIAEGISNTVLEAMASGLPVIATDVGGNPELVEHGRTGALVPASDPLAMANTIQAYLRNPGKLHEDGEAARDRAERLFSLDAMIKGYLDLYDSLLERYSSKDAQPLLAHDCCQLSNPSR